MASAKKEKKERGEHKDHKEHSRHSKKTESTGDNRAGWSSGAMDNHSDNSRDG